MPPFLVNMWDIRSVYAWAPNKRWVISRTKILGGGASAPQKNNSTGEKKIAFWWISLLYSWHFQVLLLHYVLNYYYVQKSVSWKCSCWEHRFFLKKMLIYVILLKALPWFFLGIQDLGHIDKKNPACSFKNQRTISLDPWESPTLWKHQLW